MKSLHMSQLRAGGPVIPGGISVWPESNPSEAHTGPLRQPSFCYGDEYYFYFMGGHALASPKSGRSCSLGTFNYAVAGHLAFRLTQMQVTPQQPVSGYPDPGYGYPGGLWRKGKITKQIVYLNIKISKGSRHVSRCRDRHPLARLESSLDPELSFSDIS